MHYRNKKKDKSLLSIFFKRIITLLLRILRIIVANLNENNRKVR